MLTTFVPDKYLSIDESTVYFKSRISFLAYNPKKPTKWGLHVYVLADFQTSYIYSFVPHYGKTLTDGLIKLELSFISWIVLHLYNNLLMSIPEAAGYHIFTDWFYTNLILAKELFENKCFLTRTIMPNRKGLPQKIKKPKLPRRKTIGFCKGNTPTLAWCDTRVVTLLSTFYTSDSQTIQRRLAKAKRGNIGSRTPNKTIRAKVKKNLSL